MCRRFSSEEEWTLQQHGVGIEKNMWKLYNYFFIYKKRSFNFKIKKQHFYSSSTEDSRANERTREQSVCVHVIYFYI